MARLVDKQARETDTGVATLRAHIGIVVSSLKGKRDLLLEHYRKLGTPTTNESFDEQFGKETNAWAGANVDAPGRQDSDSEELQRYFTNA